MKSLATVFFLLISVSIFSQELKPIGDILVKTHEDGQNQYLKFDSKYEWAVIEVRHNNIVKSTVHHGPKSKKGFYALLKLPFSGSAHDHVDVFVTRCRDGVIFRDSILIMNTLQGSPIGEE